MTTGAVEAVEIPAADGITLCGQRWAGNCGCLLLVHDRGEEEDLDRWAPLAPLLAARRWAVLSVDLRGHGASDVEWNPATADDDIRSMCAFARTGGDTFLGIIAAGASAAAALRCSPSVRPDAMVLLSPSMTPDEEQDNPRGSGEAKLIVVGGADVAQRANGEQLCRRAIGTVLLVNLPTVEQGASLLWGPLAAHLTEYIIGFLAEQRFLADRRPGSQGAAR